MQRLSSLLLAFAGVLATLPALAQPITYDSACGAAATGRRQDTGVLVTLDAAGAQYLRVGPDGYWRFCEAAAIKREPANCVVPRGYVWMVGGAMCRTPNGGMTVKHGAVSPALQAAGESTGLVVLQCTDGALSIRLATCEQARVCEGSHSVTEDGGRTVWRWRGWLEIGERGLAYTDDGRERDVLCVPGGTLRLQ